MKKILSFLQKKPLALAAVALVGMVPFVFAEETGEGEAAKPATDQVWTKVADGTTLKPFEKVTFVDTKFKKIYNGYHKVVTYEGENPSTEAQGQGFWVVDGFAPESPEDVANFPESSWAFRVEGEEVEEGPYTYLTQEAELQTRQLNAVVSWDKDAIGQGMVRTIHARYKKYIYYDEGLDYFTWTENQAFVDLFKQTELARPVFDPQSSAIWIDPEATAEPSINISIPGIGKNDPVGSISWKQDDGDYNDGNGTTTDVTPDYEDGVPVTITAKNVYEGGETQEVSETYTFVTIVKPVIAPVTAADYDASTGVLKINNEGTALVEITDATEGATIKYYVAEKGEEPAEPTFEEYTDELDLAEYVGKTVVVVAKATKGGAETSEVTAEFTIEPNATAEDLELELVADPLPGSEVIASQLITLYWTINNDEYDYYTLAPNPEKTKEIKLTFHTADGDVDEIVTDVDINKKGQFVFRAPKGYYNTEFDVEVVEGFYTAKSGKNEIPTPESQVSYKMGPGQTGFTVDTDPTRNKWSETREQPSDDISYVVQIYPGTDEDAVCDFANPSQEESNYGAWLAKAQDELTATIKKVEKVAEPNFFEITFTDDEALHEAIVYYLENVDEMIEFGGYSIGFPAGTFKSGEYVNKEDVTHHVKFIESVDIQLIPVDWVRCEGSEAVQLFVKATGKVLGTNFNTAYPSDDASQIEFDPEAEIKITGTDIHGDAVDATATIKWPAKESYFAYYKSKDVFFLYYDHFTLQEDGGDGTPAGNKPYTLTIPEGAFKVNKTNSPAFEGKLDVMAHPVWTATARPYSYDEGKESASTLTLDVTVTLNDFLPDTDDHVKLFEKDPRPNLVTRKDGEKVQLDIFVDNEAVESWSMADLSEVDYDENGRPFKTYTLTLNLKTPIADVADHKVNIQENTFLCNACDNEEMNIVAKANVTYKIQKVKYIIPTTQESVAYEIWGILPDGSFVDAPIDYVGETDPEARNIFNALRYNNAQFKELDETLSEGEQYVSEKDAFYPQVESTEYNADKKTTTFTISFPEGLVVNNYKMTFPAGTVQAQGYNDNADRLYNPFDVVPAYFYDATSSEEDYQKPAETPKDKVYNISTSTKQITLYLTAADLDEDDVTGNANNDILLLSGTQLTVENEKIDEVVEWKHEEAGIFTVTLPEISENGGLEPGRYTLTVPALSVTTNKIFSVVSTPTPGLYNPEAFELTINVEDFAGPADQPIEITTKTWEFDVPLSEGKVTEVNEDAEVWLVDDNGNGMPVELSKTDETTLHVTLTYDEEEEHYNFLHSTPFPPKSYVKGAGADADADAEEKGLYTLVIPAEAFTGEYATTYEDLTVKVKVIYEFVDSNTGVKDGEDNDLVTTEMEVGMETGEHEKIYFTRKFANDRFQGFAVPFDVKQADVADYFTIYRIQTVTVEEGANGKDVFKLNFVPVGEEGKAFANKPYIIKAKQTSNDTVRIALDKAVTYVEYPEVAPDIKASTTLMRFDFKNTIKEQDGSKDLLTIGWDAEYNKPNVGNTEGVTIPAWRWFMETSAKSDEPFYIKIAINGVDVDATGIDFVDAAEGDNLIFNVAGQKLNTAAKGKVNIINGKKVLVK